MGTVHVVVFARCLLLEAQRIVELFFSSVVHVDDGFSEKQRFSWDSEQLDGCQVRMRHDLALLVMFEVLAELATYRWPRLGRT